MAIMKNVHLIDTTLRDGEQAPGVVFSLPEKWRIAQLLDEAGIPEVEIGTPAMGKQEAADMRALCQAGFRFKTLSWCRATVYDIDAAVGAGTHGVHISFPVSRILLDAMNKSYAWVMNTLRTLTVYAAGRFTYVAIGAQDASRAEPAFLFDFIGEAIRLGAHRIRIADTVSELNPLTTAQLFQAIRKQFPHTDLEFHGHNDLGMATANTFMALAHGASAASVTVNGLGERAGNAALEEVVMALELTSGMQHGIHTHMLSKLSEVVSAASARPVPENKPITGSMVLSHESGVHTSCLLKNRRTYQLFAAQMVGRDETDFVFGSHSGTHALRHFMMQRSIEISEEEARLMMREIKELSRKTKRSLSVQEIQNLYFKNHFYDQ